VRLLFLFVSWLFVSPAFAGSGIEVGGLEVEGWARATAKMARNGAVYLSMKNNEAAADELLAVRTSAAKRAALHGHKMDAGVMKMRSLESVVIPANGMVMMRPGGLHLMLMGLHGPLKKGTSLPLTLTFKNAGKVSIHVKVMGMGAKGMHDRKKHTH